MKALEPYPEYKDSGVEWIGPIPLHWDSAALGRFVTFRNGADYSALEVEEGGYPVYGSGGVFRRASEYLFDGESVLFGRKGTVDKPLHVNGRFWTVDTMYFTDISRGHLVPRFVYYWATQLPYGFWLTNTALPSMTQSDLAAAKIPYLSLEEQSAIVSFLDQETAEIDAFIADQEELVQLLDERRAAVFTNHFQGVVRVQHAAREGVPLGVAISERDVRVGRAERELMSVSIHKGLVPWFTLHDKEPKADDFSSYKRVDRGDVVLNRMRAFQGAAGLARQDGMVSPDYAVFSVSVSNAPAYISELLRSLPMIEAIKLRLRGIGDEESGAIRTPRINVRDLVRIKVELPPREEQERLLDILGAQVSEIDAAIADAREAIALSKERGAALISAAVTGKIDVRNHGEVA